MDYVVGSVAALISGDVTPNRPKFVRRALTPIKHQQSPNVTPKSEFVEDRSIFLSPTLQKKKAIVKKSPKRIFGNADLDVTTENDEASMASPNADKVKKHLKDDLDANVSPKLPKNKRNKSVDKSPSKSVAENVSVQMNNEKTPKKKKSKHSVTEIVSEDIYESTNIEKNCQSPNKKSKHRPHNEENTADDVNTTHNESTGKKNKKRKSQELSEDVQPTVNENSNTKSQEIPDDIQSTETIKKNKKKKSKGLSKDIQSTDLIVQENKRKLQETSKDVQSSEGNVNKNRKRKSQELSEDVQSTEATINNDSNVNNESQSKVSKKKNKKLKLTDNQAQTEMKSPKKTKKNMVNPNAVTDKDTDSEHESDNEIQSENEEANKELLNTAPTESSDEDEPQNIEKPKKQEPVTDAEVQRTLFVGNVPFSKKLKKELKKIFNKHGAIETLRIRTIPIKDQRFTPKLAIIKNELHPERSTVNVYIKFKDASSVDKALSENNTVLNDHHLRVSRSSSTGAEHDPKLSVFLGNLPFGLEDETLRSKFASCGDIVSVRIIRDKKTNAGKGFGYVNFATKDGVELALDMKEEDLTIKNRIIRVKRCTHTQQQGQKKQGFRDRSQGFGNQGKSFAPNNQGRNFGQVNRQSGFHDKKFGGPNPKEEGAYRRVMNKRQNQDGADGPPDKRPKHLNQPFKEKKTRKEFVGMTSEKKKKHTFNKGQKKKKVLSEILRNK